MRTYLILKEKAQQWNEDKEIQAILKDINSGRKSVPAVEPYSKRVTAGLLAHEFDKDEMMGKRLPYERLDQLTVDILLGVR
jgi:xylose isomerase